MPLVTSTEMFKKAYDGGYAIGAFNVNNMEIVQGITEACQEEHAPVILQVSKGARAYANHTYLVKLVEAAVECCPDIPIVLHLDHGPDFETCKSCIDGGFTSVMIDASSKPFAENIEITKKVVEYAHDHGVVVEAELGTLAGIEDEVKVAAHEASYTHPEEVEEFVSKTGCDSLAIAIGTSHGAYKFKPEQCTRNADGILVPPPLRFDVLKEVSKRLPGFPIVLHGSSSVPQEYVKMINEHGGKMPNAIGVPEEQLRQALTGSVQLDATTQLHGHPIRKGYVFWQEDITELVALLEELRLTQEELHDIGDIIQAETAQKAQWLKLSEQNRLYDKIETVTARQLARIQEYLIALRATDDVDTTRRLLKHIVILGTYIKRRSNLVFVCDKAEDIDTTELRLSLFESAESLRLSDIRCAVQIADTAKIPPASAVAIYDAFEAIIEATLPGLQEILFCAEHTAQGWGLRCSVQCTDAPAALPGLPQMQLERDEDGLLYFTMFPAEGGSL